MPSARQRVRFVSAVRFEELGQVRKQTWTEQYSVRMNALAELLSLVFRTWPSADLRATRCRQRTGAKYFLHFIYAGVAPECGVWREYSAGE